MLAEGFQATDFIDDIMVYTRGYMMENANRLSKALKKVCVWTESMHTKKDLGEKLGFIYFNIKRLFTDTEDISLALPGEEKKKYPTKKWSS